MTKEQIISIDFDKTPDIHIRVICNDDPNEIKQQKIKYPFELFNTVRVTITTTERVFNFNIYNGFVWDGANIPRFFYRLIGSRTSNRFLIASLLHDFILDMKYYIMRNCIKEDITIPEYRRLTSLIFRETIKKHGTNTIKANIMSFFIDVFQHYFNKKRWKIENFTKGN